MPYYSPSSLAAYDEFANSPTWSRSAKGNLWREYDGLTVTIFARHGAFNYCVGDADGPRYGGPFQSEDEATYAAFVSLEGGV